MGLILATTAALCIWIVMWALGAKGFDAFLVVLAIVLAAATARLIAPYLPGNRE